MPLHWHPRALCSSPGGAQAVLHATEQHPPPQPALRSGVGRGTFPSVFPTAAVPSPANPEKAPEPKWSLNIFVLSFT